MKIVYIASAYTKCDIVLRLPGISPGADAECKLARDNNIPVLLIDRELYN